VPNRESVLRRASRAEAVGEGGLISSFIGRQAVIS